MSEDLKNFRAWYVEVLEDLRAQRDAGLVSLMIAMPLLERYIRSKNCVPPEDSLNQACMVTVCGIFQALPDVDAARKFWGVFRNGFLHQATLSLKTNAGRNLPAGSLTHDIAAPVTIRPDGSFVVNPDLFSQEVVRTIEGDFFRRCRYKFASTAAGDCIRSAIIAGDRRATHYTEHRVQIEVSTTCGSIRKHTERSIQLVAQQTADGLSIGQAGTVPPMRRNVFDPLKPTKEPRWYVIRNMHRTVLEARQLPTGADLKRALVAAMLEHIDAGWRLGEFSSRTGFLFCDRAGERRMVEISPGAPGPVSREALYSRTP